MAYEHTFFKFDFWCILSEELIYWNLLSPHGAYPVVGMAEVYQTVVSLGLRERRN